MEVGILSVRYAKALYDFAKQKQVDKEVYDIMRVLINSFTDNLRLAVTVNDPLLDPSDKIGLLMTASGIYSTHNDFQKNDLVISVIRDFLKLVINNKREGYIRTIAMNYQEIYRKENNIAIAIITTAVELDKNVEEMILKRASQILHKDIELHKVIDKKINGGFILDVDGYRVDASVFSQISKIKRTLLDKNRRIV